MRRGQSDLALIVKESTFWNTTSGFVDMSLAMASQEKPRVKRKREGGDENSDAEGRHAADLVEDAQQDNLAGRVIQPVEGNGRTYAGSGKQAKKRKKKPTVPVVTDDQLAQDGRAEGEAHAEGVGEEDDEGESAHSAALSHDARCMKLQEDLFLQTHHDQL